MTKRSNKDVRNRIFRYNSTDDMSVTFQQVKQIALGIALEQINKDSAILLDICMMAYIDTMAEIKDTHPMIDKNVIDPKNFKEKIEKYISDYDSGIFNADHLKNYVGKYRVRKVYHAE